MKRIILIVALLIPVLALAQDLRPLKVSRQDNVKLPWGLSNLTMVDGQLYGLSGDIAVRAGLRDGYVYAMIPDTLSRHIGESFSYVVRNPRDSHYYYSRINDDNGRYALYEHVKDRGRRNRQVDVRTWFREIVHPTFSSDGNMLVFSSKGKVGLGGYDLWCSFWNGKRWSKPLNMGGVVNSGGDEVCPVFYGDYLIYASNDTADSAATFHFHAVRIPNGTSTNNILFDSFHVQELPAPLNSGANDLELAVDAATQHGYWVSQRDGSMQLYAFDGSLAGVLLCGLVSNPEGIPIPEAAVNILSNDRLVTGMLTDDEGRFSLFVQPGSYQLQVTKEDYFSYLEPVNAVRLNEANLVFESQHNVQLAYLPFGRTLTFNNFYRQGADIELSSEGRKSLRPLVDFLRDNPQVKLQMTVFCDQTTDSVVNNMVIEQRINNLYDFFASVLPSVGQISIENGSELAKNEPIGSGDNKIFAILLK